MRDSIEFLRSWLFLPGHDKDRHRKIDCKDADISILDLEDFTPKAHLGMARRNIADFLSMLESEYKLGGVRINSLVDGGEEDLQAAIFGGCRLIVVPKVAAVDDVVNVSNIIDNLEKECGLRQYSVNMVANVETASGVVNAGKIVKSTNRIVAMLLSTEDLAADLGLMRTREGTELYDARRRFFLECKAANIHPIDCPYTYADIAGAKLDASTSRKFGYRSKTVVLPEFSAETNKCLLPTPEEMIEAHRFVRAFEAAVRQGKERAESEGRMVERPSYLAARRMIKFEEDRQRFIKFSKEIV